jgi:hypothetical protein
MDRIPPSPPFISFIINNLQALFLPCVAGAKVPFVNCGAREILSNFPGLLASERLPTPFPPSPFAHSGDYLAAGQHERRMASGSP